MAQIRGQHRKAQRQSCCANQQVPEGNNHTLILLLSVELPGKHGRFFRVRVHRQVCEYFIQEGLAAEIERVVAVAGDQEAALSAVSPCRSAAMTTLESRISPIRAG